MSYFIFSVIFNKQGKIVRKNPLQLDRHTRKETGHIECFTKCITLTQNKHIRTLPTISNFEQRCFMHALLHPFVKVEYSHGISLYNPRKNIRDSRIFPEGSRFFMDA